MVAHLNPDAGFWHQALGPGPERPRLEGRLQADVCIVGAGYTGLWTAWALLRAQPGLRVVLVEALDAGSGASGRNGGWLSGFLPGDRDRLAATASGRSGVVALQRQLIDAVYEVRQICADEGIDCDLHLGGTLAVATNATQMTRLRHGMAEDRRWGLTDSDVVELDGASVAARLGIDSAVGGVYSPHCARVQPAKLVRGLARAAERAGATIYERSPAVSLDAGLVRTPAGEVAAPWVVRATEGYTAGLPGLHRRLLPMSNAVAVTRPLPPGTWDRIGWDGRETVRDAAHAYVYLQRTADDRIVIGGRGVPYRFGSRLDRVGRTSVQAQAELMGALGRLFPGIAAVVERSWSGVLGVARDWCPALEVHRRGGGGGLVAAGGYAGDGVTMSYLAGRTMADLVLGDDTTRTALPWVGRRSRDWEPEPLRWLGVQAVYRLYRAADRAESRRPGRARASIWGVVAERVAGEA